MDYESTSSDPLLSKVQKKIENIKEKRKGKPLSILITGRTGTGKSALVNGLVGKEVSHEGAGLTAGTKEVAGYEFTKEDVDFIVFDSPGLQDATLDDQNTLVQVREQLVAKCSKIEIDLVVYCMDMTCIRIGESDAMAIKHLTQGFTAELWKRAVFVLTFANRVLPPPGYDGTDEEYFLEHLERFEAQIKKLIPEVSIQVVPAGYCRKTSQYPNPWKLPDRDDWFSFFWFSCFNQMEEDAAMILLSSQASRIKPTTGREKSEDDAEIHERPIYAKHSGWLSFITAEAAGASIGGALGYLGISGAVTTGGAAAVATTTGTAVAAGTGAVAVAGTAGAAGVGAAAGGAITTSVGGVGVGMAGGKVGAVAITIAGGPSGLIIGGILGLAIAFYLHRQMK